MTQKEKIRSALKYVGCFLFCTICYGLIFCFWETLGYNHPEYYEDCFELQNGYIIGEASFDADNVYCKHPQVCACLPNDAYIWVFYILAPLVIVIYETLRRKIIAERYRVLYVLCHIFIWSFLYYLLLDSNFHWTVRLVYICKFMTPMAIIMLLLNSLSAKDFKMLSVIVGIIYGILIGIFLILILPNFC